MKTIIHFLADPATSEKQVKQLIEQLKNCQETDPGKWQMYLFVIRGLAFLQRHGLNQAMKDFFITDSEEGIPYTIRLVKVLKHHVPLLEFRIIKQDTTDQDFESIVVESELIYNHFVADPEQYILN